MKNADVDALKMRIETVLPTLNEYQRRRYLSAEAKSLGRGGITLVSRLSGVSRQMLTEGVKELDNPEAEMPGHGRSRKTGGGRKPVWKDSPEILDILSEMLEAHAENAPMRLLQWTNKSLRILSAALSEKGYSANKDTVGLMLKMLGYGLQADKTTLTLKASLFDRDAQFEHINDVAGKAVAEGAPVLSIYAKKKENIGNFKNNELTNQLLKTPTDLPDHDFPIHELSKATPFEVYDSFKNQGYVNAGLSSDTSVFAVDAIRKWWYAEGIAEYENAARIVLTADCGESDSNRNRLWKFELQKLANEINKDIQIMYCPPGASKWNRTEHRMFSFISNNRQGIPLISAVIIINLIGASKTEKGLSIRCVLDEAAYEKDIEVTEQEFDSINIKKDDFHGEWNYTICRIVK